MSKNYTNQPVDNQVPFYLSDVYPDEKPWDTHKAENQTMQGLLKDSSGEYIKHLRERLEQCGEWLIFAHTTPDERDKTFKLREASFCRVRVCPFCQWRRSLLYTAKMLEAMPSVVAQHPNIRSIHLVLTVRNCAIEDLRKTVQDIGRGWQRLMQRKCVKGIVRGYVKSCEVTRGADGSAHPHIHALLMVPEWYFTHSKSYITHADWRAMWRECMRIDYDPQVSVQACRQAQGYEKTIRELTKYATKPQDLLEDADWLVEYIRQVHNLRFFSTGGVVRDALGDLERENENLIAVGEDLPDDTNTIALSWFDWKTDAQRYRHRATKLNPNKEPRSK